MSTTALDGNEIQIYGETENGWRSLGGDLETLQDKEDTNILVKFKEIVQYKSVFEERFWPVIDDTDINGSFHCEYTYADSRPSPTVSWTCFKNKLVKSAYDYRWTQSSIRVQWNPATGRQLVYLFDFLPPRGPKFTQDDFLARIPSADERKWNPFVWHAVFAEVILQQYDDAFWLLRDLVRAQEKKRLEPNHPPSDFPLLHDIARHLFHYNEIIDVAEHTLHSLVSEQVLWRKEDPDLINEHLGTWLNTHRRLQFEEKRAHSLKTRSRSLNERHLNEINLAFNLVSQGFGRAARVDSSAMTVIALVSMFFLPGTFVSGLFGTNFFAFEADPSDGWITAPEIWLYWAVTIPLTLGTVGLFGAWHWRDKWLGLFRAREERSGGAGGNGSEGGVGKETGVNGTGGDELGVDGPSRSETFDLLRRFPRVSTAWKLGNVQRKETV